MKRLTRKEISQMSLRQTLSAAKEPYAKLWAYMKPYKGRFTLGILFGALYGALNGVLVMLVKHVTNQVFPSAQAHAKMESSVALNVIIWTCMAIPALMIVRALFGYLNSYCMTWTSLKVLDDIRGDLFKRILGQSMEFFHKQKSADLMQTVFNQTRVAQQALTTISGDLVKEPLAIMSAVGVMFFYDWKFTLGALVLFPLCILPVIVVSKKVRRAGAQEEEEAGAINVIMQEAFLGIRLVKAHSREDYEHQRFTASNNKMLRSMMRWQKALQAVGQLVEVVASLGVAAALIYVWLKHQGTGGAGEFIALNGALVMLYPPAKTLSRIPILLQKCLAATTKIFELMDRPVKVMDSAEAVDLKQCRGEIEFENVSFRYDKSKPYAVSDVSFRVEHGERAALVGPTGSGKSTLFSLLLRFYDPGNGSVKVDDANVRTLTQKSLREHIGIVSQDVFLFHDTIEENIRYGRLDATEDEIIAAAKRAHAHDFIMAQSEGYKTVIGDKGMNLSGGQQQRLAIARAFLRNAPILLLDEATSALDTHHERLIQADIDELARGRTVLAIAHRLSTIRNSDKIIVLDHGKVVAIGSHDVLMQTCDLYQHLYNLQHDIESAHVRIQGESPASSAPVQPAETPAG